MKVTPVLIGLRTTVGELRLVGVVQVNHDVNAGETGLGVLCNDGEGTTDFLLLVFNNVEQVHRDDGIDLNETI